MKKGYILVDDSFLVEVSALSSLQWFVEKSILSRVFKYVQTSLSRYRLSG